MRILLILLLVVATGAALVVRSTRYPSTDVVAPSGTRYELGHRRNVCDGPRCIWYQQFYVASPDSAAMRRAALDFAGWAFAEARKAGDTEAIIVVALVPGALRLLAPARARSYSIYSRGGRLRVYEESDITGEMLMERRR